MKRRNVLIAVLLVGLMTIVSVTAVAQEKKKVKLPEMTKTKKIRIDEAQLGPAMLLGKAKELQLTEAQQIQLMAIMKEMQAKTLAVLTKAQAAKLKTLKPAPQAAQKMKTAMAKTKIVEGSDGTKSQSKKIVK